MMRKGFERLSALVLALLILLGSGCEATNALAESDSGRSPEQYVFTDYAGGYHLAEFLNGYNVLSFGDVYMGLHCMGALLVQGNYEGGGSNSGFADGENVPPSYVKGYIDAPHSVYNSRNNDVGPLYVGSGNVVETWQDWYTTRYSVNGVGTGNDSTTPVYVNDQFFNFDQAYAVVRQDQVSMQKNATVITPDENGVVTVNVGENVTLASLANVRAINIVGQMDANANTTINVLEAGDIIMPRELVNNNQPAVVEQDEVGTSLVWSFPNADAVTLPTQNWIGHVIAPDADVTQFSGNFNGCIVCANLYTNAEGHIYNYFADETSWETVFSVTKLWNDGDNADGIRPEYVEVQLLADGKPQGRRVRLEAKSGWYYLWENLPLTDDEGKEIVYSVEESPVRGYTASYDPDAKALTNTHEYETVDISGTKTWLNEWGWSRPWNIIVRLYADGHEVDSQQINTSYWGGSNSYTFKDLPKYKEGREIVYTIHEDPVPGYIGTTNGYNLINTFGEEPIAISGKKIWDDGNNADGLRPREVVVQLLANGEVIEEHHAAANTSWSFSFNNLPQHDGDGKEITYTVREKDVPEGYTATVDGYDITNHHEPETVQVSGTKTWDDNNNNDGMRPESITVILLADVIEVERKTVTAEDGWKWTFTDLPKNHNGRAIRYSVQEERPEGYTAIGIGMDLINTHEDETVDVSGKKTWDDYGDLAGRRPESITIRLMQDGQTYMTKTVTAEDRWAWSFTDLPRYHDQGVEYVYTIEEDAVPGYTTTVEDYDVLNTYIPEMVSVNGTKTWNDAENQDGKRPASITIRLYADGTEIASKSVTEADKWTWSFTDLPKYEAGKEIVYTITEDAVAGYTAVVTGYDVTNTYEPEKTSVSGAKTWNDAENQDGKRPASITIRLYADDKEFASKTVTEADQWAWSFTDLPKYADGKEIVYTITEDAVEDYTTIVTDYNVTNTYEPEKTSVSGKKTWNDAENQDGKRPASITIRLYADGVEIASKTVTGADQWAWSFTDLQKYANGKAIVYTITEDAVADYTAVVTGYNVTNTYEPEKTSVTGAKTWNDAENQDGKRPTSIVITLYADGAEIASKSVSEADQWAWSFTDLPKYSDGKQVVYTIAEDAVEGYTSVVTGYNVTNTYQPEKTSVSGAKTWNDAENQDGKRPESITIRLYADGVEIASKTVTEADQWAWSFTDLPMYAEGNKIVYTIAEDPVEDYTAEVTGYDVTNTYEPEKTSVSGAKTWNDAENQDGKRPESITIRLYADGTEVASKTVTEADQWAWSFTDLQKYVDGKEIVYTITEDAVTDYTAVVTGYNVTNTYEPEKTSVSGVKTWNDAENQDGKRPESITIRLWGNGIEVETRVVTAANNWTWSFTDLPRYAGGREIVYRINEDAVEGYTSTVSGYNVTNTYEPEKTSVSGKKTWNDAENQDGKRPASITIRLYADGTEVASKTVTAADQWMWSFTDLQKFADGKAIVYTITEDAVAGYTAVVTGYDVTNSYEPEATSVAGRKYWFGDEEALEVRPESITIRLLADGVEVDSRTVTEEDGWMWVFDDLPANRDGKEIEYSITEDVVPDYFSTVVGFNVYNSYDRTSFRVTKVWDGEEGGPISLTLYADGVRMNPQPAYEVYGHMYIWEDLPLFNDAGEQIVYSATERYMDGYMTIYSNVGEHAGKSDRVYDGGTIINRGVVNVFVRKVWGDLAEGEEAPAIQLTLYCNGEPTDVPMPSPDKHGWYKYYNLPATVNGQPAHYTVRENAMDGYVAIYTTENGDELDEATDGMTITNMRIPATGDSTPLLLWCVLLTGAGAALMMMMRRRRI